MFLNACLVNSNYRRIFFFAKRDKIVIFVTFDVVFYSKYFWFSKSFEIRSPQLLMHYIKLKNFWTFCTIFDKVLEICIYNLLLGLLGFKILFICALKNFANIILIKLKKNTFCALSYSTLNDPFNGVNFQYLLFFQCCFICSYSRPKTAFIC